MSKGRKIAGENESGNSTNRLVSWRQLENNRYEQRKPLWEKRPNEIIRLHENNNLSKSGKALERSLFSEDKSLTFVIDQNQLQSNNVKFRIISDIDSCHKSCGHCDGFHCGITVNGGKNYKEFYLKNLLTSQNGSINREAYFDTGIIKGTENHTWKLYFKAENF